MDYKKYEIKPRSSGKSFFEKAMLEGSIKIKDDITSLINEAYLVPYSGEPYVRKINNNELPERYIINKGATILFWEDGSKTIVKRCKDDKYNKRLGFLTAYFQKHCGMSKNKANKYLASLEEEE